MRRVILAALVLAVPLFGGFECTIEADPPVIWIDGDTCNYDLERGANFCNDSETLMVCEWDDLVYAYSCDDECAGLGDGTCQLDPAGSGWDVCVCASWTPGAGCEYDLDWASSTCGGDVLTYCAETDVIGAISCWGQCQDWFGSTATGYCGFDAARGSNNCICEYETCASYCNDAIWLFDCNGGGIWYDCDANCVASGYPKGVCDAGTAACVCG